jgi:hypothetical protein
MDTDYLPQENDFAANFINSRQLAAFASTLFFYSRRDFSFFTSLPVRTFAFCLPPSGVCYSTLDVGCSMFPGPLCLPPSLPRQNPMKAGALVKRAPKSTAFPIAWVPRLESEWRCDDDPIRS